MRRYAPESLILNSRSNKKADFIRTTAPSLTKDSGDSAGDSKSLGVRFLLGREKRRPCLLGRNGLKKGEREKKREIYCVLTLNAQSVSHTLWDAKSKVKADE